MKYFSLFSGIGGFELGIQQAYEDYNLRSIQQDNSKRPKKQHGIKNKLGEWECVGYSEIDKYAIQIYERHFKHKNYGDITKIIASEVPDHDLLVGGFPCQSFSIAGKRGGFKDTRGTLFFDIARILKIKRPKNFILENVKGLLSHDKGNTFATIISTLDEVGYDCQWSVLNSKNFGVPQNRERVFIIGHLRGTPRPKVFPIGESNSNIVSGNQKKQNRVADTITGRYGGRNARGTHIVDKQGKEKTKKIASCLSGGGYSGGNHSDMDLIYCGAIMSEKNKKWLKDGKQLSRNFPQGQRVYSEKGIASTIAGNAGGQGGKTGLYAIKSGDGRNVPEIGEAKRIYGKEGIAPPTKSHHTLLKDNMKIRRLTPTECERLQGFPDGWTEGVSDTQRYKTLGNAVTVNVVKEIILYK